MPNKPPPMLISKSSRIVAVLGLLAVLLLFLDLARPSFLQDGTGTAFAQAQIPAGGEEIIANCRYGASPLSKSQTPIVSEIGAGWYINFHAMPPAPVEPENGADFVHIIAVHQRKTPDGTYLPAYDVDPPLDAKFAGHIRENPGGTYIAGNEVDRIGQGETHPEIYAAAYHEIYNFIKKNDPAAQVAISALVQVTPNRQQYLDKVWDSYRQKFGVNMPVDVWTMHIYILPELGWDYDGEQWVPNGIANIALGTDKELGKRESNGYASACDDDDVYCFAEHDDMRVFEEQVIAMRKWMKDHGQQHKPLLLTEFSILYPNQVFADGSCDWVKDEYGNCFGPARVQNFMTDGFVYLKNAKDSRIGFPFDNYRLVQQWMWFSVYSDGTGEVSNLVTTESAGELSRLGTNFKNFVAHEALYKNLKIAEVADVNVASGSISDAAAKISAVFSNNGSEAIREPFTVTFYENADLTGKIASVKIDQAVKGCSSHFYTVTATWPGLTPGKHTYYVKLDSGNVIAETPSSNRDNTDSGTVTVYWKPSDPRGSPGSSFFHR